VFLPSFPPCFPGFFSSPFFSGPAPINHHQIQWTNLNPTGMEWTGMENSRGNNGTGQRSCWSCPTKADQN
jgi:hypothetical protein